MAVVRSFGRRGMPVISVCHAPDEYAALSKHVTTRVHAPDPELFEDEYVDVVRGVAAAHPGGVLFPVSDPTLQTVSRHKELFQEHVHVGCMGREGVNRCLDKAETYCVAEKAGVPVPRTLYPRSGEELRGECERLMLPCVIKPRVVHLFAPIFHQKMVKVFDYEDLVRTWEQAHAAGFDPMVQEFIPGPDHNGANYNAYVWGGEVWAECTAHKLRSFPPEIGSPRLVLSKDIPEVAASGGALLRALDVHGFANVEFKYDTRDGAFKLMEVNGRHNLSAALAIRCGIDFPAIEYDHLVHGRRPVESRAEPGVYWIGLVNDLTEGAKLMARGEASLPYLRPYLHPHVFDFVDLRDPRPFGRLVADRLKRFAAKRLPSRRPRSLAAPTAPSDAPRAGAP
jgi:predicted ATP-grasp superfamily ATP-dependent carboligase